MEKIFIKDVIGQGKEETLLSYVILECCNEKVIELIKGDPHPEDPEQDGRWIEVDFKMNGITVNLSQFLRHLESQLDRMIKEEAKNLLRKKIEDFHEKIDDTGEAIKKAMTRIAYEKLGVELTEEDYY